MPDLIYRGALFPGVPDYARVVEARGYAAFTGGPGSGSFTLDEANPAAGNMLVRATDLRWPGYDVGFPLRGAVVGWAAGVRVYTLANTAWYVEAEAGLYATVVDSTGLELPGSEVQLVPEWSPVPLGAASVYRRCTRPVLDGFLEPMPIRWPLFNDGELHERSALRATWRDNGPTAKAAGTGRYECVVAVAWWPRLDTGPLQEPKLYTPGEEAP